MNSRSIIFSVVHFFLYVLVQGALVKDLLLFDYAYCYVYVAFVLLLPFDIGRLNLMFIALGTGLTVDLFYNTLGINAAACVLLAYLRPFWRDVVPPRGGYDVGMEPTLPTMGFYWFSRYALPLILVHHLALFFLEAATSNQFFLTLLKAGSSTLFTFAVIVIIQNLFYRRKRL